MKFEDFKKNYHMAPITLMEFAEEATSIEDKPELQIAAVILVKAQEAFENALESAEIEVG